MTNKPKLRFKEFKEEWHISTIQKLLDEQIIIGHLDGNHGALYPRSEEFVPHGVPYITANDFSTGKVDTIHCKMLTEERAKLFKKGVAINGDVLFAHNATVGPVALLETLEPFVILSTTATYFRTNNSILLNKFLKTILESPFFVKQYTPIMKQSTRNQVPLLTQRKLNVMYPCLEEQKKIADFLSKVDEIIAEREAEVKDYEQQKKGLMQKLFSQQLRFTDSNNNPYPDWEEKKLYDITDVRDGTHDSPKYVKNGYPLVTSKNLTKDGKLDFTDISYITEEDYNDINKRSKVHIGDILFGMIGTIGKPVIIQEENFAIKNVALIKNTKDNLNGYLVHYLQSDGILKQFHVEIAGGTQKFIALGLIRGLKIQFPCLEEQQKIANVLSKLDELIEEKKALLSDWQQFKKGLLQQMFV